MNGQSITTQPITTPSTDIVLPIVAGLVSSIILIVMIIAVSILFCVSILYIIDYKLLPV